MAGHRTAGRLPAQPAGLCRRRVVAPAVAARRLHRPALCRPRSSQHAVRASSSVTERTAATEPPALSNGELPTPAPAAPLYTFQGEASPTGRLRVVVLGSGWGACSFVKTLRQRDSKHLDVTMVSPRNYFLYTALLPAVATGTVEERSVVEPVRKILKQKGRYFEAFCSEVDVTNRTITACFPPDAGLDEACFKIGYDVLIIAVGSINNTFGIKGVEEHTLFFKSITDAKKLRRQVSECFERAALPQTTPEERRRLLSFVIVGGGPTGVEVAAELHDTVAQDLVKIYPALMPDVAIRVVELQDHVLSTYDRLISQYTSEEFARDKIELVLNSRVASVQRGRVSVVNTATGQKDDIPFGVCVWATGVAMHPLIKALQGKLPAGSQTHFRSIVTDEFLRVAGSDGAIFALGDSATIEQAKAMAKAAELFERFDANKNGTLSLAELRSLLRESSKEYSHFQEHARFLDGKFGGAARWGGMVKKSLATARGAKAEAAPAVPHNPAFDALDEKTELTREQVDDLLESIDRGLRALPATAQVAKQQGEYLAKLLRDGKVRPGAQLPQGTQPFRYTHKGSLAYVGSDKAVMDIPRLGPVTGYTAGVMWKGFETYSQISFRNIILVSIDWVRTKLFGRDISRV